MEKLISSGFLTALTSAMFFNDDTGEIIPNPDPMGGLWIVDRGHSPVRAVIPSDNLAIQCGECLQIATGGVFVATPHCVRASKPPVGKKVNSSKTDQIVDRSIRLEEVHFLFLLILEWTFLYLHHKELVESKSLIRLCIRKFRHCKRDGIEMDSLSKSSCMRLLRDTTIGTLLCNNKKHNLKNNQC